ncbi:hypothetical protein CEP52_003961 [Fusarium oligoseptatum]|uniref:DUF4097 domain-containing protein n=1 Tax=Fusarium oligoseptatum TaxID=2604345 RepID=A0A428U5S7_9HYPO|nr:hypothetical protein CEP52_003961 [Fusarium oligoseptatum]
MPAAPYSDNLYSAADDDNSEALSPTDGYFHASSASSSSRPRPLVPNILVEDPTLASRESKAWEAERERRLLSSDAAAGASSSSDQGRTMASSPLIQHEAPPAYSPSSPTNYSTFSPMGQVQEHHPRVEEQQPLLSHGPESMSSPPHEEPSRWRRLRTSIEKTNLRRKFRTILGTFVILSVIIILLGIFFDDSSNWEPPDYINDGPIGSHGEFTWNPSRICLDTPYTFPKTTTSLRFDRSSNLEIVQTVQRDHGHRGARPHVSGEVILQPAKDSSSPAIELQVISNDKNLGVHVHFDEKTQLFKMITPDTIDWDSSEAPCIQIQATIHVPQKSTIKALKINTLHLNFDVETGFDLQVLTSTVIRSAIGHINTPAVAPKKAAVPYTLSSREINIHTASGKVKGWYPLYDLLDIDTVSGDISVNVGPKPAEGEKPATLRVHSASGQIEVHEPLSQTKDSLPPRDYIVNIGTASGDITADVATSSHARFESQSGDFKLRILPILDSSTNPALETDTKSGTSEVTILEPLWITATGGDKTPPPALSALKSKHDSISGTIKLQYPSSWEGHVSAQTVSGSQDVRGRGLEVTHEGGPFARRTRGRKGDGNSQMDVSSVSGDEYVLVGEE